MFESSKTLSLEDIEMMRLPKLFNAEKRRPRKRHFWLIPHTVLDTLSIPTGGRQPENGRPGGPPLPGGRR